MSRPAHRPKGPRVRFVLSLSHAAVRRLGALLEDYPDSSVQCLLRNIQDDDEADLVVELDGHRMWIKPV